MATNILQNVQTYQRAGLGLLLNLNCFISGIANTKFKEFNEQFLANLGSSVTYDTPIQIATYSGLTWTDNPVVQNVSTLTVTQSANTAFSFTSQERIFNVDKADVSSYMKAIGQSSIASLSATVEADVARGLASAVIIGPGFPNSGQQDTTSGPYRFYGDGRTPINSYQQLAQIVSNFDALGTVTLNKKVVLPNTIIPQIVGTGLNQFVPRRNDEIAESWLVGEFGSPPVTYYQSNLLPTHIAGTVGQTKTTGGNVLTVVSTNYVAGTGITQITFSGAGTSVTNAIIAGDLLAFNTAGLNYLTQYGYIQTNQPVQIRALNNANSDSSGNVIVNITPTLLSTTTDPNNIACNISTQIVAGMTATVMDSHICAGLIDGNAMFLAMPPLPPQDPFSSYSEIDPDTGCGLRLSTGSLLGQNQTRTGYDAIWGSRIEPKYSMRILIPLNQ